jgi:LmbE family N-acetylglucosaminyl deacetylase
MTAPVDPVPATPTGRPIVFYPAHQDDEVIEMGQVIAHHVLALREVHVVLCSNGSTSGARAEINGTAVDNGWWNGWHYPAREGYAPLSQVDFGLARTSEFVGALYQLGVKPENIHYGRADQPVTSDQLPDTISDQWGIDILTSWAEYFTARGFDQVGHYTHWKGDAQPDHAAMGRALQERHAAHPSWFGDVRWLVKPEDAVRAGASVYTLPAALAPTIVRMARNAGRVYGAWNPVVGSYAIGYHSVGPQYFEPGGVSAGVPNHYLRLP